MDKDLIIRVERQSDYKEVEDLVREAFWNVYRPGCTEHYVLRCYRDNPAFIPTGETVIDEAQYQGKGHPIRVLRLELR